MTGQPSPNAAAAPHWHRPLPVLIAALTAGIAFGGLAPGHWAVAGAVLTAAAAAIVQSIRRCCCALLAPLALLAAAGYLAIQPWEAPRLPPGHVSRFVGAGTVDLTAEVIALLHSQPDRQRVDVRIRPGNHAAGETAPTSGLLRLTVHGDGPRLSVGDALRLRATLRPIHNFANPGGFDYRTYLARQGIRAAAHVRRDRMVVDPPSDGAGLNRRLSHLRKDLHRLIQENAPSRAAGMLQAMVTGDRCELSPDLRSSFNRTGTGHLLAISGLHIGIVASAVYLGARWALSWIPWLLQLAWTRRLAALAAMVAVTAYATLAGWPPSTQRAVLMTAAVLASLVVPRRPDIVSSLALAAAVILAHHPPTLFHISFQLSFAAVIFIVLGLNLRRAPAPLDRLTAAPRPWIIKWAAIFLTVTCWAVLGTLPLVARYFNMVSLVAIPINLLVVPPAGYLAVPLGLTGVLMAAIHPAAAGPFFALAGSVLAPVIDLVQGAARLPLAAVRTVTPSPLEISAYYLLVVSAAVWRSAGTRREASAVASCRRTGIIARWAVAGALVIMLVDGAWWVHRRFFDTRLRATFLDVGQGTATLLELPRGRVWLVDGGGFGGRAAFDVGAGVVAPLLWRKKIRTVDTVVLSHPNSDHLNGLLFILDAFAVKRLLTNGQPVDTGGYRRLQRIVNRNGIPAPAFETLPRRMRINGAVIEILYPPPDFLGRTRHTPWRDANNNAMVLRCSLGERSILLPADIMAPAERDLVRRQSGRLASDLMAAPHHGSRSSSTPGLLKAVRPQWVVVSSGKGNRFRLPHPAVMRRYDQYGCRTLRIDRQGAVAAVTDGHRLTVTTALP